MMTHFRHRYGKPLKIPETESKTENYNRFSRISLGRHSLVSLCGSTYKRNSEIACSNNYVYCLVDKTSGHGRLGKLSEKINP